MNRFFPIDLYENVLNDNSLSFDAKGLYGTMIMCFNIHHPIVIEDLYKMSTDSTDVIDNAINELIAKSYISNRQEWQHQKFVNVIW